MLVIMRTISKVAMGWEWRGRHIMYRRKNDKDDSRFLIINNANKKTAKQHLENTEIQEAYAQGKHPSKMQMKQILSQK